MAPQILLLITGLVLLIKGADWLVDGASALAKKHHVSNLAIGLTIVAFGTSLPELIVSTYASYEGHTDILLGNIIGSNNFNLFVILGISGLIAPLLVRSSTIKIEIPISIVAVILLYLMAGSSIPWSNSKLSASEGLVFLTLFILFLIYVYLYSKKNPEKEPEINIKTLGTWKIWTMIVLGLVMLALGGRWIVDSSVKIAVLFGISERIIGLTILAIGTSLPELATSVIAAIKKNNDIAIGNIVGSNIFNILLILGVSSLIRPIPYSSTFNIDIYILLIGTVLLLLALWLKKDKHLDRGIAGLLLLIYVVYMVFVIKFPESDLIELIIK
ncbi:MAG: calcium/sodium antiporter [Clostridiales bacterium]|nr:calcium/sodium antiporter [Clostridiales bacterium]